MCRALGRDFSLIQGEIDAAAERHCLPREAVTAGRAVHRIRPTSRVVDATPPT